MPDTPGHQPNLTVDQILERLRNREIDQAQALNLLVSIGQGGSEAQELIRRVIISRPGADQIIPQGPDVPSRGVAEILADFKAGGIDRAKALAEMITALQAGGQNLTVANVNANKLMDAAAEDLALLSGVDVDQFQRERLSETRVGRGGLFDAFNATTFGNQPGRVQNVLNQQFDPLSARFALSGAVDPSSIPLDFRSFLGQSPSGFNQEEFGSAFDQLSPLFSGGGGGGQTPANIRSLFDEQGVVNNVIGSFLRAGTHPLFRRTIGSNLQTAFNRFRDVNPGATGTDIFSAFLQNRDLAGGGFGGGF